MKRKPSVPTHVVTCGRLINGPKMGRSRVVLWQKNCGVGYHVPEGWSNVYVDCRHHRTAKQARELRAALNPETVRGIDYKPGDAEPGPEVIAVESVADGSIWEREGRSWVHDGRRMSWAHLNLFDPLGQGFRIAREK